VGYWEEGVGLRDMVINRNVDNNVEKSANDTMIVTTIIVSNYI
jgi:hypothetical protein